MIKKRRKTNWSYILVIVILAAVASVVIFFKAYVWTGKESDASEFLFFRKPVPPPTEIDQNFLIQVNECFIPAAAAYGYTLRITSGFRSVEEQSQTFNQGRTENGHIVSWSPPGKSLHNYGFAVDVVDRWRGYDVNWKRLAKIGAFCGLEQVDDPHFEHRSGLTTAQFRDGARPPALTLPCALMDERAKANQPLTKTDLKNCGAPAF